MKAVVYAGPGRMAVEDVADARIEEPGDAVVRVMVSAICGTDLHAFGGHLDGIVPGTILGHEFVGEVVEVGGTVTTFRPGMKVMGASFAACGRCWWCRRGDHWHCEARSMFGFGTVFGKPIGGAQAEYVRVPHADAVLCRLPDGCPPEAAIFVTDTLATGFVAAERGRVAPGDVVAVVGGGAVGQMASLACQAVGAAAVVVADLLPVRRAVAAANGALGAEPATVKAVIDELTGGRGADVVVEAVGGSGPLAAAIGLVRAGGNVVSVGAHFDPAFPFPSDRAFDQELSLTFGIGDSIRVRDRLLPLVSSGVLDPTVVVTSTVSLADVPAAYERFARHEELKVLIL
jgi:threonine dehydrogenase-like Zn-dependent dehydrogenase